MAEWHKQPFGLLANPTLRRLSECPWLSGGPVVRSPNRACTLVSNPPMHLDRTQASSEGRVLAHGIAPKACMRKTPCIAEL